MKLDGTFDSVMTAIRQEFLANEAKSVKSQAESLFLPRGAPCGQHHGGNTTGTGTEAKLEATANGVSGAKVEKIPLGYVKSTSRLPTQIRVPHGYLGLKNVVYATRGVTTVVSATYGFTDLPHGYLTPSSTTSPLPDPFIYHSPTNTFFRYIMGSKVVQMVLVPFVTRIAKGRECGLGRKGVEEEARVQV